MPSPDHCGLSDRRRRGSVPHPRRWPHGASAFDARSPGRVGWETNLSEGHTAHARPTAVDGFAVRDVPERPRLPTTNYCRKLEIKLSLPDEQVCISARQNCQIHSRVVNSREKPQEKSFRAYILVTH